MTLGATLAAAEAKLIAPLQISAVRPTDHGGPGSYYVCVREATPPPDQRQRYYAAFFDNDTYKGSRLSVIMDGCETQMFSAEDRHTRLVRLMGAQ
jgi:hypothetical protein